MQAYQIGPAFAKDLIDQRPFGCCDEVAKLSGIGKVRLASLQSLFLLSAQKPFRSASSGKTCSLNDGYLADTAFKPLRGERVRGDPNPDCSGSAISKLSFQTASSDLSILSADGLRCFLPSTLLPCSRGNYRSVDSFNVGDVVLSAAGALLKITSFKVLDEASQKCVTLCAGDVTSKFTQSHRVSILRAGERQAVKAETLRPGDDVYMSGLKTQKLSEVTFFMQECPVYEFMFAPDYPVESYTMLPGAILTHGRRTRR